MIDSIAYLATDLKKARMNQKLSQRGLARKAGMPQAQISRIENAAVDPKTSTLIELARTLGLEVVLVPRKHLTAVKALAGLTAKQAGALQQPGPAYALDDESGDE
ncbi:MAG: helix-turn-helix transcriptional regulator [Desulfobacterales bacterium]